MTVREVRGTSFLCWRLRCGRAGRAGSLTPSTAGLAARAGEQELAVALFRPRQGKAARAALSLELRGSPSPRGAALVCGAASGVDSRCALGVHDGGVSGGGPSAGSLGLWFLVLASGDEAGAVRVRTGSPPVVAGVLSTSTRSPPVMAGGIGDVMSREPVCVLLPAGFNSRPWQAGGPPIRRGRRRGRRGRPATTALRFRHGGEPAVPCSASPCVLAGEPPG